MGKKNYKTILSLDNANRCRKPEMGGIKDDLYSQLEVALETANNAARKLGLSFNTDN